MHETIDYNVKKFGYTEHPLSTSSFFYIVLLVVSGTQHRQITLEEWRCPPDRHDAQTGELSEAHLQVNQREPGENHHDDVRDQERACAKEMNRFVSGFCAVQLEIGFAVHLVTSYSRCINRLYSSSLVIFSYQRIQPIYILAAFQFSTLLHNIYIMKTADLRIHCIPNSTSTEKLGL